MGEIILNNRMTAEYNLMSMGESSINLSMIIGNYYENDIAIEYEVREMENSNIQLSYEVTYGGESSIYIEYQPVMTSFIGIEYEINPNNRMRVSYDLQKPPTIEVSSFPIQDSFVASRSPYAIVNYGRNNSMMVGQDQKGENIAYVKFDTSSIPQGVIIKSAKARLYYSQMAKDQVIEMYRIREDWSEYGITYRNLPAEDEFLTNEYINNEKEFYIEFDITDLANNWSDGLLNYGLTLRANEGISVLRTREFPQAPTLIVEYYSPTPAIYTNSRIYTEFEIARKLESSIGIQYDIHSDYAFSDIELEYFVKAPNDVFEEMFDIEYTIDEKIPTEIDSVIGMEFEILGENFDYITTEFEIPQYESNSTITIEYAVFNYDKSNIELEFEIPKYEESNEFEINYFLPFSVESSINIEFDIDGYELDESNVNMEFEINEYLGESIINTEFNVYEYADSNINIEYEIVHKLTSEIKFEFEINEYDSESIITIEFTIPYKHSSEIELELEVPQYNGESIIENQFYIIAYDKSEIELDFEVPFYEESSTIDFDFSVVQYANSDFTIQYEVPQFEGTSSFVLDFGIIGYENSDIIIQYEVAVKATSKIEFEFGVWGYGDDTISIEYLPRVEFLNTIELEFEVNFYNDAEVIEIEYEVIENTSSYSYVYII